MDGQFCGLSVDCLSNVSKPSWIVDRAVCIRVKRRLTDRTYHDTVRNTAISSIDELQADLDIWLDEYNQSRPHSGEYCFGNTPMQTFLDSLPLTKEKLLNKTVQTVADVA